MEARSPLVRAALVMLVATSAVVGARAHCAAQVRTRPVDVRWYPRIADLPSSAPAAGPTPIVGLDCARNVSPPFRATRCRAVSPRMLDPQGLYLTSLSACYRGGTAPDAATIGALVHAFDAASAGANEFAVALPAGSPPVIVLVRWRDDGLGAHCSRWTRHCTGIDCNMVPARRFCAASTMVPTHETSLAWAWSENGAVHVTTAVRNLPIAARVARFDAVTFDAQDTSTERATVGVLPPDALLVLARTTADPVARYAAWLDLAVDAWVGENDEALESAMQEAVRALPDALALAPPPAVRLLLADALAQLQRADGYRASAPLRSACP